MILETVKTANNRVGGGNPNFGGGKPALPFELAFRAFSTKNQKSDSKFYMSEKTFNDLGLSSKGLLCHKVWTDNTKTKIEAILLEVVPEDRAVVLKGAEKGEIKGKNFKSTTFAGFMLDAGLISSDDSKHGKRQFLKLTPLSDADKKAMGAEGRTLYTVSSDTSTQNAYNSEEAAGEGNTTKAEAEAEVTSNAGAAPAIEEQEEV